MRLTQYLFCLVMQCIAFGALAEPVASTDVDLVPAPKVRYYHHVPFITGGVGEELDALKKIAKTYPLRMVFSEDGAYVAEVTVGVYDTTGALVFYNKKSGPYLYVNLPDGDYSVVAIYQGEKRSHKVTLQASESKKVFFSWSSPDGEPRAEDVDEENFVAP